MTIDPVGTASAVLDPAMAVIRGPLVVSIQRSPRRFCGRTTDPAELVTVTVYEPEVTFSQQ